jgi:excinuclease ABC subunit B
MAEDLTEYYAELGVRVRYLHSDVDTLERIELLRDLRAGQYDVLVGINLLREGLDLPEVSLVAILDADKEGFLRSARSLIQTIGRAARNSRGRVLMYADRITPAMSHAMGETERRRILQRRYNEEHGITPTTISRAILDGMSQSGERDYYAVPSGRGSRGDQAPAGAGKADLDAADRVERMEAVRQEMFLAAENLEFEKAARLRDELRRLAGPAGSGAASGAAPEPRSGRKKAARASGKKKRPGRSRSGA